MSLKPIELKTVKDLYDFVERSAFPTALILQDDALFCPWARAVSAALSEVHWYFPSAPMEEKLVQHLCNFVHIATVGKGFAVLNEGRVVAVIDVDALDGSSQPHRLEHLVKAALHPRQEASAVRRISSPVDPYSVLGASQADSDEEIKKRYKHAVLEYHPDRVAHLGQELRDLAGRKTLAINEAFLAIRRKRGF